MAEYWTFIKDTAGNGPLRGLPGVSSAAQEIPLDTVRDMRSRHAEPRVSVFFSRESASETFPQPGVRADEYVVGHHPSDYRVQELVDVAGRSEGSSHEHPVTYLQVHKVNLSTRDVRATIAKVLGIDSCSVRFCGMTEKRADVQQFFSIQPSITEDSVGSLNDTFQRYYGPLGKTLEIKVVGHGEGHLSADDGLGIRYDLNIRNVSGTSRDALETLLGSDPDLSFPNYYDRQTLQVPLVVGKFFYLGEVEKRYGVAITEILRVVRDDPPLATSEEGIGRLFRGLRESDNPSKDAGMLFDKVCRDFTTRERREAQKSYHRHVWNGKAVEAIRQALPAEKYWIEHINGYIGNIPLFWTAPLDGLPPIPGNSGSSGEDCPPRALVCTPHEVTSRMTPDGAYRGMYSLQIGFTLPPDAYASMFLRSLLARIYVAEPGR
jgi:hypothetical protein